MRLGGVGHLTVTLRGAREVDKKYSNLLRPIDNGKEKNVSVRGGLVRAPLIYVQNGGQIDD